MICPHCHKHNPHDEGWCESCWNPLPQPRQARHPPSPPAQPQHENVQPPSGVSVYRDDTPSHDDPTTQFVKQMLLDAQIASLNKPKTNTSNRHWDRPPSNGSKSNDPIKQNTPPPLPEIRVDPYANFSGFLRIAAILLPLDCLLRLILDAKHLSQNSFSVRPGFFAFYFLDGLLAVLLVFYFFKKRRVAIHLGKCFLGLGFLQAGGALFFPKAFTWIPFSYKVLQDPQTIKFLGMAGLAYYGSVFLYFCRSNRLAHTVRNYGPTYYAPNNSPSAIGGFLLLFLAVVILELWLRGMVVLGLLVSGDKEISTLGYRLLIGIGLSVLLGVYFIISVFKKRKYSIWLGCGYFALNIILCTLLCKLPAKILLTEKAYSKVGNFDINENSFYLSIGYYIVLILYLTLSRRVKETLVLVLWKENPVPTHTKSVRQG